VRHLAKNDENKPKNNSSIIPVNIAMKWIYKLKYDRHHKLTIKQKNVMRR